VVVITAFADVEKVKAALNEGAAYLLEKPFRAPELIAAIEHACQPRGSAARAVDELLSRARLTEKERAVARHVLQGMSSGEIAALENNSEKTIRQHLTQIYSKCGVSTRLELLRKVHSLGGRASRGCDLRNKTAAVPPNSTDDYSRWRRRSLSPRRGPS
jgi:DNA-binding NarL/FixJ family response regulator